MSIFFVLTGCAKKETEKPSEASSEATMKYGVNLGEFPDKKGDDYALEFDWQYDLAEKYGRIFYKANNICGNKFSYILDKATDTSTEEGALTIDEFNKAYEQCVRESLVNQPIIPEKDRVKLTNIESVNSEVESNLSLNENRSDEHLKTIQSKNYTYDDGGWRYDDVKQKWVNAHDDGRTDIVVMYRDGRVKPATKEPVPAVPGKMSKEEELNHVRKVLDEGDAPPEVKVMVYCTRKSEIYYANDIDNQKIEFANCVNQFSGSF